MSGGAARADAIHERRRNVIVDASAGTGKTTLVIERLLELVAPSDGDAPLPIERIAAITFTRKAAGELRVRTRHKILETLAALPADAPRTAPLLRALGGIDTAHISTIHGFADRLLRDWPAQARLDPRYQLDDDTAGLVDACYGALVAAADAGTLGDLLHGSAVAERAEEATATIRDFQRAGLRLRSLETEHWTYQGLDGLIEGFVLRRDADATDASSTTFERASFERFAHELVDRVTGLAVASRGARWLHDTAAVVERALGEDDPAVIYRELVDRLERGPRGKASDAPRLGVDFDGDKAAWDVWKALVGDDRKTAVRVGSLREDLLTPLRRWLGSRLVRLRPVVLHVYEDVKARRGVVDQIDLLLRLRDLLRDDREVRRACQARFDHVFIDEFQDTDPLQAEIASFLCEQGADAARWDEVTLTPGKLTVVGDPKQSIYRFRRADIATYQRVLDLVRRSPHLAVQLAASYRSAPALVTWLNERFTGIMGGASPAGEIAYQPLSLGRRTGAAQTVHAVAMDLPDGGTAADYRALEAATMARYVRWLVACGDARICDPATGEARPIRYADIGVLSITTTHLPTLFRAFDADGVPYASRGGTLFIGDPLHRQFLLGLCALADRDDGVAFAALLRPPFFALELADLARERRDDPADPAVQARALVRELRRQRFARSPGATARALLEDTAFGRVTALGPNGAQRVAALRELCFQIERLAIAEALDFDGVMERARSWIDRPPQLDRPPPVGDDAVRVLTVHQAKGLEFPVVVLWDGRAPWTERVRHEAWSVARDGRAWALRLDALSWQEPPGLDLAAAEQAQREAERKRLVYVAATRTRDLLVVPMVGAPDRRWIYGTLLDGPRSATVREQPLHTPAAHAAWFDAATPASPPPPRSTTRDVELAATWTHRAGVAARSQLRPTAFSDATTPRALWGKRGRFGTCFGETVHLAIGFALRRDVTSAEAVRCAARQTGLARQLVVAEEDVTRALATLADLSIARASTFELEYAVSGQGPGGDLVSGYIDLLAVAPTGLLLVDFKTDAPPTSVEPIPSGYIAQVAGYATAIERACQTEVRAGVLYTADGSVHWLQGR